MGPYQTLRAQAKAGVLALTPILITEIDTSRSSQTTALSDDLRASSARGKAVDALTEIPSVFTIASAITAKRRKSRSTYPIASNTRSFLNSRRTKSVVSRPLDCQTSRSLSACVASSRRSTSKPLIPSWQFHTIDLPYWIIRRGRNS